MSEKINVDQKAINRLKIKIILKENQNLKDRKMSDSEMVKWIKNQIEEEVKCCLNR